MLCGRTVRLTLVARRPEPLEEAAAELDALAVPANLGDADECIRVVAAHAERYGGMDVLVELGGHRRGGTFAEQDTKKIALQLDVNLRATLVITRESLHLRVSRGQVITLASIAGTIPTPGLAVYGATESSAHRVDDLAESRGSRARHPRDGDLPGFVATRMTEWTGLPAEEQISPDDIVALVRAVLSLSPMARVPNIVVERLGFTGSGRQGAAGGSQRGPPEWLPRFAFPAQWRKPAATGSARVTFSLAPQTGGRHGRPAIVRSLQRRP